MKLAVLALLLGLSGVAAADVAARSDDVGSMTRGSLGPVDPYAGPPPPVAPYAAPPPAMLKQPRQQRPLKQFLLAKFDRNHDGRLEPRERKQAAKALHRLANRLAQGDGRGQRRQKFIRRFDLNGDGNVGPGEMPPALANEMRPLDRDGDGWLTGGELP